jgi:hypothetical protein
MSLWDCAPTSWLTVLFPAVVGVVFRVRPDTVSVHLDPVDTLRHRVRDLMEESAHRDAVLEVMQRTREELR